VTSNRKIFVGLASEPNQDATAVGILKLVRRGVVESGEYAYGKRYLASPIAFALNPDHMPLKDAPMSISECRLRDGGALPLTFRDALPDSWGRLVLEAQHGRKLDDIDALLLTNVDRVGAMVFSETLPIESNTPDINLVALEDMAEAVRRLELSMEITPDMRRLLQRGATLGGARPKATFIHENKRWISKFPAQGDDHDVELLEICILKLAAVCSIDVSPAKLEKIHRGHALLLRRFDREGNIGNERRIHYLSASALLNVPYESNGGSYIELAQILRRISADPKHDLEQLFRRMIFNLMIDNTDDHVKNHGVLHVGYGQYKLAPAFDLVMQLTNMGYQELAIKPGNNNSKISLAKDAAPHFGINEQDAENIIQSIHKTVTDELIKIVSTYGGDNKLIERVHVCLERQHELIFGQE
jgi:serine/threonine-protein kinase HipA